MVQFPPPASIKMKVYLDNAATTKIDSKVFDSMNPYLTQSYGNASSKHYLGKEARMAVENSRNVILDYLGANEGDKLIFACGGTEANNILLKGLFFSQGKKKNHIITTKVEHDCILNACRWLESQGARVTYLDVNEEGFVNPKDVEKAITSKTLVISIIHGNNEVGTLQDLEAIGKICKKKRVYFHTDACQSFTKSRINVKKDNLDFVTINGHKIHGPKGVGALYVKKGIDLVPLLHGGGHEGGLRSGTENVPGIVGFAKAVEISKGKDVREMKKLRGYFIEELLKIERVSLNGPKKKRICNNINVSFEGIEGEIMVSYLSKKGIAVSSGSACSSHSLELSHVLKAMGVEEGMIKSSIRISISKYTTKKEIDHSLKIIGDAAKSLRV